MKKKLYSLGDIVRCIIPDTYDQPSSSISVQTINRHYMYRIVDVEELHGNDYYRVCELSVGLKKYTLSNLEISMLPLWSAGHFELCSVTHKPANVKPHNTIKLTKEDIYQLMTISRANGIAGVNNETIFNEYINRKTSGTT